MIRGMIAAAFCLATTAAFAQNVKITHTSAGAALQTRAGKSLYVYDGDQVDQGGQGKSSCAGQCAKTWPPFLAKAGAKPHGRWGLITRPNGSKQWTYKKRPLYTFARASTPDATAGNGYNGNKWHVAKP